MTKEDVLESREALIEMYKAGFLDGFSVFSKPRTEPEWNQLNKNYKLCFDKRFGNQITKILKKQEKEKKEENLKRCKGAKKNG